MKLVMICFLVFLSLNAGARAELADFSSPYPKSEHFPDAPKTREFNPVREFNPARRYEPAIIWHTPPIASQITNPELLKSESLDELAINYLLEGCRQENPDFVKIEKKFKFQNSKIHQMGKRFIQAGYQHIGSNLIRGQDSDQSSSQYEHAIRYIKNNFWEYKQFYQAQESHNQKILESSQSAKRNLEELCGKTAVQRVISLYQEL